QRERIRRRRGCRWTAGTAHRDSRRGARGARAPTRGHRGVTSAAAEIGTLDALGQADLVRRRQVSAAELVTWAVERIEHLNPVLNAVVTPVFERALAAAKTNP